MSQAWFWRGKYFFYPIGNTPAVCLSKDIPGNVPANILLLGCGDPRSILFTVFSEPHLKSSVTDVGEMQRQLDFTCCDFDAAILSRNLLLFTMLMENVPVLTIWNIFYHAYIDNTTMQSLKTHLKIVLPYSRSIEAWEQSPYGFCLKFSTAYTLLEVRRHWNLYADMDKLPPNRLHSLKEKYQEASQKILARANVMSPARSAGPTMLRQDTLSVAADHYRHYWKTGMVAIDQSSSLSTRGKVLNPTLTYSIAGEGFDVHYGTDPLSSFLLAAVHGNAKKPMTIWTLGQGALAQFTLWCTAFKIAFASNRFPIIRFFNGEALRVCSALETFATTGNLNSGIATSPWKSVGIRLQATEYRDADAPIEFDIIDTSNLADHVGLLNVMLAVAPLRSRHVTSGVIYTEILLLAVQNATKEFTKRLFMDIGAFACIFGFCPVDYISGFSSRSNTHEIMLRTYYGSDKSITQFHQVHTWKSVMAVHDLAAKSLFTNPDLSFDCIQLGTFLYDVYQRMFEEHDAKNFWRIHSPKKSGTERAIAMNGVVHNNRETFAILLGQVKKLLAASTQTWAEIMNRFNDLQVTDETIPMDTLSRHELATHLQIRDVWSTPQYAGSSLPIGPFSGWKSVPAIVRIVAIFPRDKLAVLEESEATPPLLISIASHSTLNTYSSIQAAFGNAILLGSEQDSWVSFSEDPLGQYGSAPLVVSFACMSIALTQVDYWQDLRLGLHVMSLPAITTLFVKKLGLSLEVCSVPLMDRSSVFIVPEYVHVPRRCADKSDAFPRSLSADSVEMGSCGPAHIQLDEECELMVSITIRIAIENQKAMTAFQVDRQTPTVKQVSPCSMQVTLGDFAQIILYPFVILGRRNIIRVARKSLYIEVEVPVSGPKKADGIQNWRFPAVRIHNNIHLFNVHRINLLRAPKLNVKGHGLAEWLGPHLALQMSDRERNLRSRKDTTDTLMNLKDSLHSILVSATGIQKEKLYRVFSLAESTGKNNSDTIIFVEDVRYDLSAHTVVCNAFLLPLEPHIVRTLSTDIGQLLDRKELMMIKMKAAEVLEWKRLLPALAERCRQGWCHGPNCEYQIEGRVPRTEKMEQNPICSCGQGKDNARMLKEPLWKAFAPFVTRIALSPLFAVSYLESVGRDPESRKCFVCRGRGKPKIRVCSKCQRTRYCSDKCQKKDWATHKKTCKSV